MSASLKIDWCSHEAAKYAVEHWHYSRRMPKGKLARLGVWEDDAFIGCILFGNGATADLVKRFGLKQPQGCELVRVALKSHDNAVTRMIAIALRMIRRSFPKLRMIVSFADVEHGHHGGIYQGGGWVYTGKSSCADEYIFRGRRWHGRAFRCKYKGMEKSPQVKIVKGSSKHRYLMPLDNEMKQLANSIAKPYPKRAGSDTSDTVAFHAAKGGSRPTPALSVVSNA